MHSSTYKDIIKFLKNIIPGGDRGQVARRISIMSSLISSCVEKGHCRLEGLSEARDGYKTEKKASLLQQSKRWLSNKWTDIDTFYLPFMQKFLSGVASEGELIFIIDGSQTGSATTTLMLSVLYKGFAIPVCWVVKKGEKGHFEETMHLDLMKMVANICPSGCRLILLGDGEFDGKQLREWLVNNQWEFVVRTSCDRKIDFGGETARFDSIPTKEPRYFIENALNNANAVFWHENGYQDPLFLLTNMDLAEQACQYYKRRFKIETLFKHLKSAGFFLHKTRLKCPNKVANLIIIVAFAFIFSYCIGAFLKRNLTQDKLEAIVRKDRLTKITYIALAQAAIKQCNEIALTFFSLIAMDFNHIFP